ncbi:unnamed protein product [Notodromas monacha]|uniref:(S)-2-hydroxy-acid oxidase n=1 Tax=Notodromas monacha TaxID=399045 RepID=A0A7R9GD01_9CRUS|nr:unnamed protein product [Notodromas monacha]CAG0918188.1 unnamed protein product [Notodromas monacha]
MSDVDDDDSDCWSTVSKELPTLESILNDDAAGNPSLVQELCDQDVTGCEQKLPSLESILAEEGDESLTSDDEFFESAGNPSTSRSEAESKSSTGCVGGNGSQSETIRPLDDNSVVEHAVFRGISSQISSASMHADAGRATAIAVRGSIAVGMTHGLVLIFNANQSLSSALGGNTETKEYGSVSCMDWNADCSRLLVGFSKGSVSCYDAVRGRLVRHFTQPVSPGCGTLNAKFTDGPGTRAVISDSGGSVWEIKIKRRLGDESDSGRCLFSGARGEVVSIAPLVPAAHQSPGRQLMEDTTRMAGSILAMASFLVATISQGPEKNLYMEIMVIVVTTRPKLGVIFSHPLPGDPRSLPLMSWQAVVIQLPADRGRVVDPVFTFCRDREVFFFQLTYTAALLHPGKPMQFLPLRKLDLDYSLLALAWVNAHVFVVVDSEERLHVRDARLTKEVPEVVELAGVEMVYGSVDFKGFSTGGKVSKAMALVADRACYYSFASAPGQARLVFLGMNGVHAITLRTWVKRVDYLLNNGRHLEALALCDDVLSNKAVGAIGVGQRKSERRAAASKLLSGMVEALKSNALEHLQICVAYSMKIPSSIGGISSDSVTRENAIDTIFDYVKDNHAAVLAFFECLEPKVLAGEITFLNPAIVQTLVEMYEAEGKLDVLEDWLVRLEILCLDFDQVVRLCVKHSLVDAYISCHNRGLGDFVSPLEDLLVKLDAHLRSTSESTLLGSEAIQLGNKILVYISCCLGGRAYPLNGPLMASAPGYSPPPQSAVTASSVKFRVLACLTSIHTRNAGDDEAAYPRLRTLLNFDSLAFLNVLAMAFEAEEFKTDLGLRQKQRLVDILIQIVFEESRTEFKLGEAASDNLLLFLARQVAWTEEGHFHLSPEVWRRLMDYLFSPAKPKREERQSAICQLLGVKTVESQWLRTWDEMIALAEEAEFFRVCEILYDHKGEKDKILWCYLRDPGRRGRIFPYLKQKFSEDDEVIISRSYDLATVDAEEFADFIAHIRPDLLQKIIDQLGSVKSADGCPLLFAFLDALVSIVNDEGGLRGLEVTCGTWELYFDLLAEHRPYAVVLSLKKFDGEYRFDPVYQLCKKHGLAEAQAYLLEKSGDFQGALDILLKDVEEQLNFALSTDEGDIVTRLAKVESKMLVIVEACQRNCRHGLADDASTEGWFSLLGMVLKAQRRTDAAALIPSVSKGLMDMAKHLTASMLSYVSLSTILDKLLRDPSYRTGKFGEVKDLILGMTKAYNYEATVMESARNLSFNEKAGRAVQLVKAAQAGIGPGSGSHCSICRKAGVGRRQLPAIVFFRKCGHWFHENCLNARQADSDAILNKSALKCFSCSASDNAVEASALNLRASSAKVGSMYLSLTNMLNERSRGKILCIDDLRQAAVEKIPKMALDYYRSGADEQITLRENHLAFQRLRLRPRFMVDVSVRNLESEILGSRVNLPIGIAPTALQKMAHPEGECASARAAQAMGTVFVLSTIATSSVEQVAAAAPDCIKWLQLYIYKDRKVTVDLLKRAENAGFKAVAVTVDAPYFGQRLADVRNQFSLPNHLRMENFAKYGATSSATKGANQSAGGSGINEYVASLFDQTLTWQDLAWLKRATKLPVIVKGVLTGEDALLALDYGADAIWVSNHGARQLDTVSATIEVLPEVVEAVKGRCDVFMDGGVEKGTDVLKALALGAKMVFVGRPILWGLAHDGFDGVHTALKILRKELDLAMALSGCTSVSSIPTTLVSRETDRGKL